MFVSLRSRVHTQHLLAICVLVLFGASASAQTIQSKAGARDRLGEQINLNTVAVVSGNLNATYLAIAYDLSAVLDDGDNLRVLPIIGKGGGQNIRDVRFLKGVDLGITQTNLLNRFRRTNEIGPLDDKLVYIAKLFNEEMHVVVRTDSGITALDQLAGKKVNFSDVGSGTQLSTRDIFERLNIAAEEVNMGQADAFEALKRGEIAASVLIAGKPTGSTTRLRAADGYRLLPVPFAAALQSDYLPTALTHEDYPQLIERGQTLETVAVSAVLIAYNWPKGTERYRRIERFVNVFFPRLADFQKPPRHGKWRETNLAAAFPGWKRFEPAELWLQENKETIAAATRTDFDQFLLARGMRQGQAEALQPQQRDDLFREFLRWSERRRKQ
jgi:TRAP transporter TAXI family solute receptor